MHASYVCLSHWGFIKICINNFKNGNFLTLFFFPMLYPPHIHTQIHTHTHTHIYTYIYLIKSCCKHGFHLLSLSLSLSLSSLSLSLSLSMFLSAIEFGWSSRRHQDSTKHIKLMHVIFFATMKYTQVGAHWWTSRM